MPAIDAVAAAVALLRADTNLTVYDNRVDANPATGAPPARPYVAVWGAAPAAMLDTLSGRSGWFECRFRTTVTADNGESLRIVQRRVIAALLDVRPDVTGRVSVPIRMDGDPDTPLVDQDVQPPVLYAGVDWIASSTPA